MEEPSANSEEVDWAPVPSCRGLVALALYPAHLPRMFLWTGTTRPDYRRMMADGGTVRFDDHTIDLPGPMDYTYNKASEIVGSTDNMYVSDAGSSVPGAGVGAELVV